MPYSCRLKLQDQGLAGDNWVKRLVSNPSSGRTESGGFELKPSEVQTDFLQSAW